MITNNFKKVITTRLSSTSSPRVQIIATDGTTKEAAINYALLASYSETGYSGVCRFAIGSGTTQATQEDTALEERITEGYTNTGTVTHTDDAILIEGAITNTGTETITISEYGIIQAPESTYDFLITRKTLTTPVELAPGEVLSLATRLIF